MMDISRYVCVVILLCVGGAVSFDKTWRWDTNFDNSSNWVRKQVPCERSVVVFPPDMVLASMLPSRTIVLRGLVLPKDGVLLLPKDGGLIITDQSTGYSCPDTEVHFVQSEPRDWYDPDSWTLDMEQEAHRRAIPHSEQVPCHTDTAIFPSGRTVHVKIPSVGAEVGQLNIDGQNLEQHTSASFLRTSLGRAQFIPENGSSLNVTKATCTDVTGCPCATDRPEELEMVCAEQVPKCGQVHCTQPIMPTGHCCDFCGAFLAMEFEARRFRWETFHQSVRQFIRRKGYSTDVILHAGKISYDVVQVVLADKSESGYGESGVAAASALLAYLQGDDGKDLGVVKVSLKTSGGPAPGWGRLEGGSPGIFAILAILVMLGLLALLAWLYRKGRLVPALRTIQSRLPSMPQVSLGRLPNLMAAMRVRGVKGGSGVQNLPPFRFARFDNDEPGAGAAGVELGASEMGKAFENPLFGHEDAPPSEGTTLTNQSFESSDKEDDEDKKGPLVQLDD